MFQLHTVNIELIRAKVTLMDYIVTLDHKIIQVKGSDPSMYQCINEN